MSRKTVTCICYQGCAEHCRSISFSHVYASSLVQETRSSSARSERDFQVNTQDIFPDGVLWLDFRNKLDREGLLLTERLQDLLRDLNPLAADAHLLSDCRDRSALEAQISPFLTKRSFLIVVDNVHAHDIGEPRTSIYYVYVFT